MLMPVSGTSFFKIRMGRSGANRCLAASNGSNAVTLRLCTDGGQGQEWSREQVLSSDLHHYKIRNRLNQRVLTPSQGFVITSVDDAFNSDHWLFYR